MLKRYCLVPILLAGILFFAGCSVQLGDRVAGIHGGKFFYTEGNLVVNYDVSLERTWKASEKTMADIQASDIEVDRKVSGGVLTGTLKGEDIRISLKYLEKELTQVSVRVGLTGNSIAAEMIQTKIKKNLINM